MKPIKNQQDRYANCISGKLKITYVLWYTKENQKGAYK